MSTSTHIAFFGATGGCAGFCLSHALKAGMDCTALARTPAKLTSSMKEKGVSAEALDNHLTIIQGDVKDLEAVKRTLAPNGNVCSKIVGGIGTYPKWQWKLNPVGMIDPTLCEDANNTILQALQALKPTNKPTLINMTTTGIQPAGKPRDVPLLCVPFYHWVLAGPHKDKKAVEVNLARHFQLPESERALSGYVNLRASLLMDGDALGLQSVRHGVDDEPAVGYTIRRADVGMFMFEMLVKEDSLRPEWANNGVTVTY